MKPFNIVLHEPEMPGNTGNIGRTCVATGARLHLIEPLGFRIDEKAVKRAGLDYWDKLDVTVYDDMDDFMRRNPGAKLYYATTKGQNKYSDVHFEEGAYIMFGKESAGIPEEILVKHPGEAIRIPMNPDIRSLNLSNSAAIVLYEALRQHDFEGMETVGQLHHLHW
ncbi:MAG: tRNA (cytidine(34)-2'-O)-methyltransferase [Lachnospiraceae bacterium]|nr:tRNA (cytidine(34)-2'-O)-methyltransferase [Lachnospiraceae bacterium]